MSKKTHQMTALKEQERAKRAAPISVAPKKNNSAKKQPSSASKTAGRGGARSFDRAAAMPAAYSVMYLRIVGGLIAAGALGGGIYWGLNVGQNFTPWVIVGLLGLGLLAGLGAFTAIRAKDVAARARASRRK